MNLEVNIDSKAVETQLVQAMTESAIGAKLQDAINEAISKPERYGSDSLLESCVKEVVRETIRNEVRALLLGDDCDFKARVREGVVAAATDEVIGNLVKRTFEKVGAY